MNGQQSASLSGNANVIARIVGYHNTVTIGVAAMQSSPPHRPRRAVPTSRAIRNRVGVRPPHPLSLQPNQPAAARAARICWNRCGTGWARLTRRLPTV
jgi:hypothetical protein